MFSVFQSVMDESQSMSAPKQAAMSGMKRTRSNAALDDVSDPIEASGVWLCVASCVAATRFSLLVGGDFFCQKKNNFIFIVLSCYRGDAQRCAIIDVASLSSRQCCCCHNIAHGSNCTYVKQSLFLRRCFNVMIDCSLFFNVGD